MMYERTRNLIIYANTLVLLCTLVLLIVLASTGTSSTSNMYWGKIKDNNLIQWWSNYTICYKFLENKFGYTHETHCSDMIFGNLVLDLMSDDQVKIQSIVGLSLVLSTLLLALLAFIPSCISIFKKQGLGNLLCPLISVSFGFVVGLSGVTLLTIVDLRAINNSGSLGHLGPCFAIAWLCTGLFLISVILSTIILLSRDKNHKEITGKEVKEEYSSSLEF